MSSLQDHATAPVAPVPFSRIDKAVLSVVVLVVAALCTWTAQEVWASKLDTRTFEQHLQSHALQDQRDSMWHEETQAELREIMCAVKPQGRGCR